MTVVTRQLNLAPCARIPAGAVLGLSAARRLIRSTSRPLGNTPCTPAYPLGHRRLVTTATIGRDDIALGYEVSTPILVVDSPSDKEDQPVPNPLDTVDDGYPKGYLLAHTQQDKRKLWMAAIKPPMYSVGIAPVLVGAALAYRVTGVWPGAQCGLLCLAAVLVIAWLNLSNDAFDATTSVDETKPESVVNLTGNRTGVLVLSKMLLATGVGLLLHLISAVGDWRPAIWLSVAIACGYVYQGPPFRLSYKGLGEPICFVAFGPLAVAAFYLVQLGSAAAGAAITPTVWAASAIMGITTSAILFCSHFHQIKGDTAAGKRSPLVRLGTAKGVEVLKQTVNVTHLLVVAMVVLRLLPTTCAALLIMTGLPTGQRMINYAVENHTVDENIKPLKKYAIQWHIGVTLALVFGLVRKGG